MNKDAVEGGGVLSDTLSLPKGAAVLGSKVPRQVPASLEGSAGAGGQFQAVYRIKLQSITPWGKDRNAKGEFLTVSGWDVTG